MKRAISKNPLFFAFIFPSLVDGAVTLVGQDASYWTHRIVNEASPAYYVLYASPWLFVIGSILWFSLLYWLFKKIKEPFNLFLMLLLVIGHSWGSSSWIWRMFYLPGGYQVTNQASAMIAWGIMVLYFALIAVFATYCLRIYLKQNKP